MISLNTLCPLSWSLSQYYTSLWLSLPSTNFANLFIQSQFMSIFFGLKILKRNFFVAIAIAKWSGQVVHLNHAMFFFGVIHKWCHLFSVTFFRDRGSKSQYIYTEKFIYAWHRQYFFDLLTNDHPCANNGQTFS